MLRLTKQADYAVVLLTQMAQDGPEVSHSARDLSQSVHLPLPIVSKILKILTREGLTVSHRGVHGVTFGQQLFDQAVELPPRDALVSQVLVDGLLSHGLLLGHR